MTEADMHHRTADDIQHDEFNPHDTLVPEELYHKFDELRQRCPVAHSSQYGGFWLLTKYDDIKRAAANDELFISSVKAVMPSDPRGLRRPPLNYDAPAHTPYRRALDRTLKPVRLERLKARLEEHARDEILQFMANGPGDICADFGARFVAWLEIEWLNLTDDLAEVVRDAAPNFIRSWRKMDAAGINEASGRLYGVARELVTMRKQLPMDPELDPASSLLEETTASGEHLGEDNVVAALRQSLVVAMAAPPVLMGSICKHLSEDLQLQQTLRDNPDLIPKAADEFVRLYTPYRGFCRTVKRPTEMHGRLVRPGEPITMTYAAANRDPDVFEDPSSFRLDRPNLAAHLGFGHGRHRCAGMPLARIAIQIALSTILEMTQKIEVDLSDVEWSPLPDVGTVYCTVKLTPAPAYASNA